MTPTLSVLIPATPDRKPDFTFLMLSLSTQVWGGLSLIQHVKVSETMTKRVYLSEDGVVEVVLLIDDKQMTIGQKRQMLYESASGKYSFQIDSDDLIADNAIELILKAIDENPDVDVISFCEKCLINGVEYKSRFSNEYADWEGEGNELLSDGFHFHRTIFYKCVIKTELAKQVPFKPIRFGEDHEFAKDLKPLIQTERHIPEQLYHYIHNSKPQDFNERYGFK